jgi:hypothetical protein
MHSQEFTMPSHAYYALTCNTMQSHGEKLCYHKLHTVQPHAAAARDIKKGWEGRIIQSSIQKIAKKSSQNSEFGTTRPQPEIGHFHHLPPPESLRVLHESCS